MLVGEWPGDNGKVIAGMGGMILSQVTFVPAFWGRVSGGFPCSFFGRRRPVWCCLVPAAFGGQEG